MAHIFQRIVDIRHFRKVSQRKSNKEPAADTLVCVHDKFTYAGRSTYLQINLKTIWHNIQSLQTKCASHTKVIAVIKANAYGHGSVGVAKYLNKCGVFNFAVATTYEGKELRKHGVVGFIQVFGNCVAEEIDTILEYNLTPTVTNLKFIEQLAAKLTERKTKTSLLRKCINDNVCKFKPSVVIKIDTGMSRNGCQCEELSSFMNACQTHKIPVHSIMTHFAQSWDDLEFTQQQLNRFLEVTQPYRLNGVKVHAANSGAIMKGFAIDLDYVRPGGAIYGLAPDSTSDAYSEMEALGLRPVLSWIAKPCLIKSIQTEKKSGLLKPERIAIFSFGFADGYSRLLSGKGVLTDMKGKIYKIVDRVAMDTVAVRVDDSVTVDTPFYVLKDDYSSPNSASNIGDMTDNIADAVVTSLSLRLPRVYVTH
uniref:Alanine racemase C-terminal domain-containing protein n=3 Tax=Arion vulgaris TaxID=1028688 RepID=A0A0B7A724_9EUPU